ncbi:MAG TPA: hypothetical protein VLH39_03310, partial [Magnetospirillaceae bacterium]|nr:hypothetical protein [Magnetospirillaceae bacterium]
LKSGEAIDLVFRKFGGISDSMAGGWKQAMTNYENSVGALREAFGKLIATNFQPLLSSITALINKWAEAVEVRAEYERIGQKKKAGVEITFDENVAYYTELIAQLNQQRALAEAEDRFTGGNLAVAEIDRKLSEAVKALDYAQLAQRAEQQKSKEAITAAPDPTIVALVRENYAKLQEFLADIQAQERKADFYGESGESAYGRFQDLTFAFQELTRGMSLGPQGEALAESIRALLESEYADAFTQWQAEAHESNISANVIREADAFQWQAEAWEPKISAYDLSFIQKVSGFVDALGGVQQVAGAAAGSLGGVAGSLASAAVSGGAMGVVLELVSYVFQGISSVLGPVLNNLLEPLVGILTIVGETIGKLLLPVLELVSPIVKLIASVFVTVYNYVIVPIGNAIIYLFDMVYNAFAWLYNTISRILRVMTLGLVRIGTIQYRDFEDNKLTRIDTADLETAGESASGSGSPGSSASYTGNTIYLNVYNYAPLVGDTSLRQFARDIMDLISEEALLA